MITDAELNKLEDNFETADLLRAVDEIDKMRGYLNDREHPGKLHQRMLQIDRWRKKSCVPEEGRVGRIEKTPEIEGSGSGFRHFAILQTERESLKTKEFSSFLGRIKLEHR